MTKIRLICSAALFIFPIHVLAMPSSSSSGRFTISSSGNEITDKRTHLIWQANIENETMIWSNSSTHCINLGNGWRLPSIEELETLVDFRNNHPALDTTVFDNPPSYKFWTSTTYTNDENDAWMIDFSDGTSSTEEKEEHSFLVRCVKKE